MRLTSKRKMIIKPKLCPWCHDKTKPMKSHEVEWTVYDDDFAKPVPLKLVKHCFACGRKLEDEKK